MPTRTETSDNSPARRETLEGLGPLSNPRVFRAFVWLNFGGFLFGTTIILLAGGVIFVAGVVLSGLMISKKLSYLRPRIAAPARIDAVNVVGAAAAAVGMLMVFYVVREELSIGLLAKATLAVAGLGLWY